MEKHILAKMDVTQNSVKQTEQTLFKVFMIYIQSHLKVFTNKILNKLCKMYCMLPKLGYCTEFRERQKNKKNTMGVGSEKFC